MKRATERTLLATLVVVFMFGWLAIPVSGGPKRVDQTLCYDWNPSTGICGSTVTIHTDPSELKGRLHRADTLRQVKAADAGYTALSGRFVVDDAGGCNWGDPTCATCKTKFVITGNMTGCDSACESCYIRPTK